MTLSAEDIRSALPDRVKKSLHQDLLDKIAQTINDPEMLSYYKENIISYTSVMKDGKFTVPQYLDAVRYVSHKLMGATNIEAYSKTFPDKIVDFQNRGVVAKDIASYVTAYNKGKLVQGIFAQSLIPVHVMHHDIYQKALYAQFELGMSAASEKVRSDALNSVMVQLKPPEVKKLEIDVAVKEDSGIDALRQVTINLAAEQKRMIQSGMMNAQDVAHQSLIIDVTANEVKE